MRTSSFALFAVIVAASFTVVGQVVAYNGPSPAGRSRGDGGADAVDNVVPTSIPGLKRAIYRLSRRTYELVGHTELNAAIEDSENAVYEMGKQMERLDRVIDVAAGTEEWLRAEQEKRDDAPIMTSEELEGEAIEEGVQMAAKRLAPTVAAGPVGWAIGIGLTAQDALNYGGRKIINEMSADEIQELLDRHRVATSDLYDMWRILDEARDAEREKLEELKRIRDRDRALRSRLAREELGARFWANTDRVTDAEGDEKLREEWQRQELEEGIGRADGQPPVWNGEPRMTITPAN